MVKRYLSQLCIIVRKLSPNVSYSRTLCKRMVSFLQPFGHNQSQATILEENTILKATEVQFANKPTVSNEAKVACRRRLSFYFIQR